MEGCLSPNRERPSGRSTSPRSAARSSRSASPARTR
jgi:hypothetical protein